jgi:hypothetical protein
MADSLREIASVAPGSTSDVQDRGAAGVRVVVTLADGVTLYGDGALEELAAENALTAVTTYLADTAPDDA